MNTPRIALIGVIALSVGLLVGAGDGHAADFVWTNTSASGCWQTPTSWTTNGGGMGSWPGTNDNAWFTNAATYSVTLSNDVLNIQSNFFSNAAYTTATVTLNLGAYELNPIYTGNLPGAFLVGDGPNSTTIVYLASSTVSGKGLVVPGRIVVGRNGIGILFVTNGNVLVNSTILGNGTGGRGTLVLSGTNTVWINTNTFAVGNHSNSFGSSLVISNFASMTVTSSFRLGSSSGQGGCSNNTLVLDTNGRLFTHSGPVTIGHRSSAAEPSYNNTATVQGGAVWDNGNESFVIGSADGGAATGNVLRIMAGSFVTNISYLTITATNTLDLQGGWIDTSATTNSGTIQGCGTITGNMVVDAGGTVLADCGGTLNFSGIVTNNGTVVAANGTFIDFYGPVVNNGLINATNGGVQFFSTFENNGTLLSNGSTGTVNSWTSDVSGSWFASSNWSLGAIPTNMHSVLITNGLTKTVTFSGLGYPQTISNLLVSAPVDDTNTLWVFLSGPGFRALTVLNSLTISTGGVLMVAGGGPNITNHQFTVSGLSGGAFTIDGQSVLGGIAIATNVPTYVGYLGNGTMRINGTMFSGREAYVGFNPGSSGELSIDGGTNTLSASLVVGYLADATGAVWFTAGQLAVTNAATYVGSNGVGQITVSNGTMLARDLFVGTSSGSQGTLTVAGGSLVAANAGNTGLTDVRRGSMTINGGAVTVDQLFVTNGPAAGFGLNGGTLNTKSTTISNGSVVDVGDGTSAATLHLIGGIHSFANDLRIRTNAFLTGCGTITGNVVVDVGGTVLADCGSTLNFSGTVTNNGTVTATGGTVLKFYGPVVNNGLIDATGGDVQFLSTINNSGLILTPTNSWTDGTGKWETATNWSHATAPSSSDTANLITNAGNNTVIIDGTTAGYFPSTMAIRNLTVSAPDGAANTLFLDNVGTLTPLQVLGNLMLKTNGAMVVNNSAVQAANSVSIGSSGPGNSLVLSNGGSVFTTNLTVGFGSTASSNLVQLDSGSLIVTNGSGTARVMVNGGSLLLGAGTFKADNLVVTNGGAVQYTQTYQVENATVAIAGGGVQAGSNLVVGSSANSTGIVAVTDGGQLTVTNGVFGVGNDGSSTNGTGVGHVIVSNGTVLASIILLGSSAGGHGDLTILSNGVVSFEMSSAGTNTAVVCNDLDVRGGMLYINNGFTYAGKDAPQTITISDGGMAICLNTYIGYDNTGTMTIADGGTMTNSSRLVVGEKPGSAGQVWITGGQLVETSPLLATIIGNDGVGQLTLSNGSVQATRMVVSNPNSGTLSIQGGSLTANLLINPNGRLLFGQGQLIASATTNANGQSFVIGDGVRPATMKLTGGIHSFDNGLEVSAYASLAGCGTISGSVVVDAGGTVLADCGGTLTFMGTVNNHGTIFAAAGSTIDFNGLVVNYGVIVTNSAIHFNAGLVNNGTLLDAAADSDGDGMNNADEALAGTNPLNSASVFRILTIAREGNDLRVTWSTVGGKRYVVQTSPGASGSYSNNFTDLGATISMPGTGESTTSYLDPSGAANVPARYYRVRLVP